VHLNYQQINIRILTCTFTCNCKHTECKLSISIIALGAIVLWDK